MARATDTNAGCTLSTRTNSFGLSGPTIGHFPRHVEQESAITLICPAQQLIKVRHQSCFLSRTSPRPSLYAFVFWKCGWILAIIKQLVQGKLKGARHFLQGLD